MALSCSVGLLSLVALAMSPGMGGTGGEFVDHVPIEDVRFEGKSAEIPRSSHRVLRVVAEGMGQYPDIRIEVQGHTSSTGGRRRNRKLSRRRAAAVRDHLIGLGIDAARLEARGYGETRPKAHNTTATGRATNERVEFLLIEPAS